MSVSLKRKLSALAARLPSQQSPAHIQGREPTNALDVDHLASSSASHLWLHLQKHTPCKPSTSLQSFFATESRSTPQPDDMLEESWLGVGGSRSYRHCSASPNGGRASDADEGLDGRPAPTAARDDLSSNPHHLLGAMANPEYILDADDELLLGDECFEVANLLASHSSEVS